MNTNKKLKKSGYLALSYHYICPEKQNDPFPKLLGTRRGEFREHLIMLKQNYEILSLEETLKFSYGNFSPKPGHCGMLLTFDDGLSGHYQAAQILAEYNIKGVFFIPTCILMDELPINPVIVHYCIAIYGISGFLKAYREALEEYKINVSEYDVTFRKGKDEPWKTISNIKNTLNYKLHYFETRKVLIHIYRNLMLQEYPRAIELMHLTPKHIRQILKMGHSIGTHSHSHISIAANQLSREEFFKEMIEPKQYLENTFSVFINALSYPFGKTQDYLTSKELIRQTKKYKMAFTVEEKVNTKDTSPFELGRYMPMSTDNNVELQKKLKQIISVSLLR